MTDFENPHWGFPFARGNYVEQMSAEHITACEARIVTTPAGSRVERPEFGIPWPMFQQLPIELGPISAAMKRFEPQGDGNPTQYLDLIAEGTGHIRYDIEIHTENQ
jgi:hypothetical protein